MFLHSWLRRAGHMGKSTAAYCWSIVVLMGGDETSMVCACAIAALCTYLQAIQNLRENAALSGAGLPPQATDLHDLPYRYVSAEWRHGVKGPRVQPPQTRLPPARQPDSADRLGGFVSGCTALVWI